MKESNINIFKLLFVLVLAVVLVSGSTFAYLGWQTNTQQKSNVISSVGQEFKCFIEGGENITSNEYMLAPTDCTNAEYAVQRTIKVTPTMERSDIAVDMDVWIDIENIGSGLSNSLNFKYALTSSSTSCTDGIIAFGNFNGKNAGDKIDLLDKLYSNGTTTETYFLYIWLDSEESSTSTMNQPFNLKVNGSCTQTYSPLDSESSGSESSEPEAPVLDSGMIPVTISADGVVTTISENDSSWYDYDNKEWANVVLVTDGTRSSYLNTSGVTVADADILAYYVWIPRYKYQIWTTETSSAGEEQTIDIVFESASSAMSYGTAVGEYRTHPAFVWDGEIVSGIWVGKFETTGDATTPTVLPNVSSLRSQKVSAQFTTSLKFAGGTQSGSSITFAGNNTYGLISTTDSHMMKNSEWGAVAYLSHSQYGINYEIRINNNSSCITGCGASEENGTSTLTCEIAYGSGATEYPQSTTGNITGIFDMSGGAWEYVMGVYSDSNGNPRSGYGSGSNSGFNGLLYNGTEYTSGISFPDSKYYDLYLSSQFTGDYSTNMSLCTLDSCGGHALSETAGWYGDFPYFVYYDNPWFYRGGKFGGFSSTGAFYAFNNNGSAFSDGSWRSVLIVGFGT